MVPFSASNKYEGADLGGSTPFLLTEQSGKLKEVTARGQPSSSALPPLREIKVLKVGIERIIHCNAEGLHNSFGNYMELNAGASDFL